MPKDSCEGVRVENCGREKVKCLAGRRRAAQAASKADGFIIIAVLWMLAALAALASVYALYLANTAISTRVYDHRLKSEAMVTAGLELTAYRLLGFDDASRPSSGAFDFQIEGSHIDVEFHSEGARIDLNLAPKPLLSGLLVALGAKPDDADSFADRIIAWRTKPPAAGANPEAEAYKSAGLNYGPRQAPFQDSAELRLVRDLPAVLVNAALPFVTVFNDKAEIDVNEAAPEVIAALPHMNPATVAEIIKRRDPRNPEAVLNILGEARANVAVGGRKATRASVRVTLEGGRNINADVVILILATGPEPYRVLAWRDDFDGPV
ncbi:MAG TPA: type II secretion system protein GspK [Methylocella sp.]|nr:type II secretion system protein GspK [Methylocella sp.]